MSPCIVTANRDFDDAEGEGIALSKHPKAHPAGTITVAAAGDSSEWRVRRECGLLLSQRMGGSGVGVGCRD